MPDRPSQAVRPSSALLQRKFSFIDVIGISLGAEFLDFVDCPGWLYHRNYVIAITDIPVEVAQNPRHPGAGGNHPMHKLFLNQANFCQL